MNEFKPTTNGLLVLGMIVLGGFVCYGWLEGSIEPSFANPIILTIIAGFLGLLRSGK